MSNCECSGLRNADPAAAAPTTTTSESLQEIAGTEPSFRAGDRLHRLHRSVRYHHQWYQALCVVFVAGGFLASSRALFANIAGVNPLLAPAVCATVRP